MSITYLKKATWTAETGQEDVRAAVQSMLDEIEAEGDDAARRFACQFDKWDGEIVVAPESLEAAKQSVPQKLKDDIRFAHDNIRRFAEAQKTTISDCSLKIVPGFTAGQRQIPVAAARISRLEGMEGHARTADVRLEKFFPNDRFDLSS